MSRAGHPLTVLRDRNFRWFCTSDAVDLLGTSMAPVALAFAVLHVAGSAQALSQVLAAYIGAQVAFVLVGGLAADRFPRTLVLQGSNVVSCLAQGTVGALVITDRATITALVVLVAIGGAASAFGMPATEGVVPQLVTREHLQQANAIMAFGRRGSMVLGPAIAGLLVATAGPGWAIIADAATFLLATLALARVNLPPRTVATGSSESVSFFGQLREGWTHVHSRTWLWAVIAAFGVINAIQAGAWGVLGPVIANASPHLGARGWGLAVSAQAVGAIGMTLLLMRLPLNRPLRQGMVGVSVMAIPLGLLGFRPEAWFLATAAVLGGAGIEIFGTGWRTALMEQVPPDALSRVASFDMLGSFIAIPAGTLLYGWLATRADVATVLVISAIVYATTALATLLVPSVRRLQRLSSSPTTRTSGSVR